jgi:hypothetical protein
MNLLWRCDAPKAIGSLASILYFGAESGAALRVSHLRRTALATIMIAEIIMGPYGDSAR